MPKISIVVTAINGAATIARCLKALERQQGDINAEIIVVGGDDPETAERIRCDFPRIKFLRQTERLSIPALRAIGAAQATGEIIVVTEDRCEADDNWLAEIDRAHARGYPVVGGAIEPDGIKGILNWAVYLCEYSGIMLPIQDGETGGAAGNNASYRREILERVDANVRKNCWEYFLHEELRKSGVKFLSAPSVIVRKNIDFSFFYFLGQRFHYSRSFAGMRRGMMTPPQRAIYAAIAAALPALMLWRIAQQVFHKRRYRKKFLLALPLLSVFMTSYAAGEFAGYLFGSGASLLKVE
jgi:glycosyltransferase involved in cell wall biosynthesis